MHDIEYIVYNEDITCKYWELVFYNYRNLDLWLMNSYLTLAGSGHNWSLFHQVWWECGPEPLQHSHMPHDLWHNLCSCAGGTTPFPTGDFLNQWIQQVCMAHQFLHAFISNTSFFNSKLREPICWEKLTLILACCNMYTATMWNFSG